VISCPEPVFFYAGVTEEVRDKPSVDKISGL